MKRLYLCDRCRQYMGMGQWPIVRYEYADRLEARVIKLGVGIAQIRETVKRDLESVRPIK